MLIEIVIRINSENRLTTIIGGRTVELQCGVILCHLDYVGRLPNQIKD